MKDSPSLCSQFAVGTLQKKNYNAVTASSRMPLLMPLFTLLFFQFNFIFITEAANILQIQVYNFKNEMEWEWKKTWMLETEVKLTCEKIDICMTCDVLLSIRKFFSTFFF